MHLDLSAGTKQHCLEQRVSGLLLHEIAYKSCPYNHNCAAQSALTRHVTHYKIVLKQGLVS